MQQLMGQEEPTHLPEEKAPNDLSEKSVILKKGRLSPLSK